MAHSSEDRSQFLRNLAEYPYVYYAAKKAGINPSTIYRWMKSNPDFAREARMCLQSGLRNQNQKIEMVLVKKALDGDLGAIKFYLPQTQKRISDHHIPKTESKEFAFTKLVKCGECGSGITAYEKFRRLGDGGAARYVYYYVHEGQGCRLQKPVRE